MLDQVERENRAIKETIRTLIHSSNLPKFLWDELARTAVYVLNEVVNKAQTTTPYENWFNTKPSVANLHVIGSKVYKHIPINKRKALDKTAKTGYLVGYGKSKLLFRVHFPSERLVKTY